MKRVAIGAGLIVMLAFAAAALANIRHYHGHTEGGGKVRFVTKVNGNGEATKVRRFVFNRVPMQCDDGSSTVGNAGNPAPPMKVNDENRFHGKFTSPSGKKHFNIRGRLKHDDQKARGILRVNGDFGGGATSCHTGKTHWRAKHGS